MSNFMKDKNEIKIFILYLMDRIGYPVKFGDVCSILYQENIVSYFECGDCFTELVDANHITESGCSLVVDRYHGMAFLTLQSGNSNYENVYFDSETITLPPGVTFLPTQKYGGTTSGTAQTYFTAVFTNITGPIDVVVDLATHSTSYDYVKPTITMTYV